MFQSRQRIGTPKLVLFAVFGFALGLAGGYVFMGTVHAVSNTTPKACAGSYVWDLTCHVAFFAGTLLAISKSQMYWQY